MSQACFQTGKGPMIAYKPLLGLRRCVCLSTAFVGKYPALASIVVCASEQTRNWTLVEEADFPRVAAAKRRSGKGSEVIAFVTAADCAAGFWSTETNAFTVASAPDKLALLDRLKSTIGMCGR